MRYYNGYLKPEFNKSGMKQITNTGYKIFDKQNICVSTGNVIGPTQSSLYLNDFTVRPENNNWTGVNEALLRSLMDRYGTVIFYQFHVWYGRKKVPFYQAAVDDNGNKVWSRLFESTNGTEKRYQASQWINKYITKEN